MAITCPQVCRGLARNGVILSHTQPTIGSAALGLPSWSFQHSKLNANEAFSDLINRLDTKADTLFREGESCLGQLRHLEASLVALHGILVGHQVPISDQRLRLLDSFGKKYFGLYNTKISRAEAQILVLTRILNYRNKVLSQVAYAFITAEVINIELGSLLQDLKDLRSPGKCVQIQTDMSAISTGMQRIAKAREHGRKNEGGKADRVLLDRGDVGKSERIPSQLL